MIKENSKFKHFLRSLFLVLGFIVFIFLTFWLSWKYFEKQAEEDVSGLNPTYFPIVAFQNEKAEVIMFDEIESYKKKFPSVVFLVAQGKDELIKQQLLKTQKERGNKGIPEIRVKEIGEGKQLIEFEISKDGFYLSRYKATDKTVKPLIFKIAGPGFVFLPCGTTIIIGFIGFTILQTISWFFKKQKIMNFNQ